MQCKVVPLILEDSTVAFITEPWFGFSLCLHAGPAKEDTIALRGPPRQRSWSSSCSEVVTLLPVKDLDMFCTFGVGYDMTWLVWYFGTLAYFGTQAYDVSILLAHWRGCPQCSPGTYDFIFSSIVSFDVLLWMYSACLQSLWMVSCWCLCYFPCVILFKLTSSLPRRAGHYIT